MTADVVEAIDVSLPVLAKDYIEACDIVAQPVTSLLKSNFVCDELPFPGEDGSSFQLVEFGRRVPIRWESPDSISGLLIGGGGATPIAGNRAQDRSTHY